MAKARVTSNRDAGRAFEARVIEYLQANGCTARKVPLSGAHLQYGKGDIEAVIHGVEHLIEAKKSRGKSISIKYEWIKKIANEAGDRSKVPLLTFSFSHSDLYVAIPLFQYLEMRRLLALKP